MVMTSRERVLRTLAFQPCDRAPRQLWRLPWVDMYAADELAAVLKEFPEDFAGAGGLAPGSRTRGEPCRKGTYVDEWGCSFDVLEDGVVGEVKHAPLDDWADLDRFTPPWEMIENADWDHVNRAQDENLSGENKFMLCGTTVRPFERMQFLRGTENLFLDMAYGTGEFRRMCEMVHGFFLKELEGLARTNCDGVSFMDDWGSQTSLLISPAMWRDIFKPMYKDYCDIIRGAGKKVFMHSDGHIFDIYEDLIEIGVDAVNSQLFCMDIEEIGRRFKGRITFWGEIDRQHILPFGTVPEVRAAVARVRAALDDGNGGVIAECEWGKENPADNIRAVFEAWL